MSEFYLYRHIRNDTNVPFYVGIGVKPKTYSKIKQEYKRAFYGVVNKGDRSGWWVKLFNKINKDVEVEIMYESTSFEEIKQKEREFISLYGRRDKNKGSLVNMTDGGEGVLGLIMSEEQRKKNGDIHRGRKMLPHVKEAIRQSNLGHTRNLGKKLSDVTKSKMSDSAKKIIKTDNWIHNLKSSAKNRKKPPVFTEEHRKKIGEKSLGRIFSEESKIKKSQTLKGRKRPEWLKQHLSNVLKGKKMSDETKFKMSASRTGMKHTEEAKQKMRKPKSEAHKLNIKLNHWRNGKT